MDRIINVKVGGNHIVKDSKYAGVKGEGNVTQLRIWFDEGWDGYSKEVTFFDAYGENPVKVYLEGQLWDADDPNAGMYYVPIPYEPLAEAGMMTFVIDGILDTPNGQRRQRTVSDKLVVKDSPSTENAVNAVEPTPTELEQVRTYLEYIKGNIHGAIEAKEDILGMSVSVETLPTYQDATVDKTEKDGKVHLHFGVPQGNKGDTGESGVYIGGEEPTDPNASVWIDTDGEGEDVYVLSDEDKAAILEMVKRELAVVELEARLTATGWTGSSAPFTQIVSVNGITANTNGTISVSESATDEQFNASVLAIIRKTSQGLNTITVKAYGEKPSVDIPVTIKIGG